MITKAHFASKFFLSLSVVLLAQLYLFLRFRQAVRVWRLSPRIKFWLIGLAGLTLASLFTLNFFLAFRPVPWLDQPAAAGAILFYFPAVWVFGSTIAALLLGLTQLLGRAWRSVKRSYRGAAVQAVALPVDLSRRRFVQVGLGGLVAAPLMVSGYGAFYADKAYEIRELSLPFGSPLRVVQLTDIHAGLYMSREEIRSLADRVSALRPDLLVLTGDYISNSMKFLPGCVAELGRVRSRYGNFASMGNHDRWYGRQDETLRLFKEHGITFLLNEHRVVDTEQGPLAVIGIDDLMAGRPNLEASLRGLDEGLPAILLSHRPEIFPQAAARGIAITLAGHYHGGQIKLRLPGEDLSVARLLTPYPEGLFRLRDSHLYVSRGVGTTFIPVRLNARPEVTLLHLT